MTRSGKAPRCGAWVSITATEEIRTIPVPTAARSSIGCRAIGGNCVGNGRVQSDRVPQCLLACCQSHVRKVILHPSSLQAYLKSSGFLWVIWVKTSSWWLANPNWGGNWICSAQSRPDNFEVRGKNCIGTLWFFCWCTSKEIVAVESKFLFFANVPWE